MKKLVIITIVAIIGLVAINVLLYNRINDLQKQNNELYNINLELEEQIEKATNQVSITDFWIWGFKPYKELVIYESNVIIKIKNFGINDIENLTLVIMAFGDEQLIERLQLDIIKSGEEKEISTHAYWLYGAHGTSTVTAMLGNKMLDKYSLPFSSVY